MRVAVIGGGIGGLASAVGLQRSGADVRVYERREGLLHAGSGLSLFANARSALGALGLGAAFDEIASSGAAALPSGQRRPDGHWLARFPASSTQSLRVLRWGDLRAVLLDALSPGTVRTGVRARLDPASGNLVLPHDERGGAGAMDLVVAADGLRSAVRRSWASDPGIVYSGYGTWRGITTAPVALDAAGETWGRALRFGYVPLPDGRVYWFAVATMAEDARTEDEIAVVRRLCGNWHQPIPALIAATDPAGVTRWPIHELAGALDSYVDGRTVLLGDAAHAMTPNLGQGAGQALEDAATLATVLSGQAQAGDPDPEAVSAALARYDTLRRARTQAIARRSSLIGRVAQTRSPMLSALRDAALRATPPAAIGRQLQTVQRWEPPTPS